MDILPDSRAKVQTNTIRGAGMTWVPIFCANCGVPNGYVPEENCTFACWLCNKCAESWGEEFSTMLMPDEVFWAQVKQEQIEKYKQILSESELSEVQKHGQDSVAKLLRSK